MKRLLPWVALVLIAAAAYGLSYRLMTVKAAGAAGSDQLAWLRSEFHLTEAQFASIKALHEAYQPVCAGHCAHIMALQTRLAALERDGKKDSPAYTEALQEWGSLKHACADATLRHMQAVAASMDPAEGRRYLALVTPRIARQNHEQPLSLK